LYDFLLQKDPRAARAALEAIEKSIAVLRDFPFTCRKATPDDPFLRELVIPFGGGGYVALFEIEDAKTVTVLAVRHQREDDYR
jgi:plasmid stabilization system protein ParE